MEHAATSAWSFGWEALVAIGTLLLATGTFWLALATRATASAARAAADAAADDVRAQWRPALVPGEDRRADYLVDDKELLIFIRNVGRGPALSIRAGVIHQGVDYPAEIANTNGTEFWNSTALPVGESLDLRFRVPARPESCEIVLDYVDLAGRPYASRISVNRVSVSDGKQAFDALLMTRVWLLENASVTPWPLPDS